jgi:hypothetical protein
MAKETATYQQLQSILAHEGCPICRLSLQAVSTYLDTLLWESSTDLNVYELLTASLGFCGRHSRELLTFEGQRLAAAVVERTALLAAIRRLPDFATTTTGSAPPQFRLWPPRQQAKEQPSGHQILSGSVKPCPACGRQADEAARGIEVLLAHLGEFSGPLLAAGGLCLPHFVQATRAAGTQERAALLDIEQRAWTDLAGHLEEFIGKHKDHQHAEPISEQGRLALERTIAALTGEYPAR